jgi:hypothetical protein
MHRGTKHHGHDQGTDDDADEQTRDYRDDAHGVSSSLIHSTSNTIASGSNGATGFPHHLRVNIVPRFLAQKRAAMPSDLPPFMLGTPPHSPPQGDDSQKVLSEAVLINQII